jgi:2-polyprenyl-3-methyl-5-hydroxy-6-metoxy-1,4-benzoquinol methylase
MPGLLRKWLSYLHEQVIEHIHSPVSGPLEVWLAYGRYELNTQEVNYSFGELHKVFRDAFAKLKVAELRPSSVLLLGLGAGSVVRLLRELGVAAPITAVELDPVVVKLGKKYFSLGEVKDLEVLEGVDATEWLPTQRRQFDLVVVDLFVGEKVPATAASPAFLQALKDAVSPDGMMMWNRLAHEERLETDTNDFYRWAEGVLPGLISMPVRGNRMLVWRNAKA